MSDFEQLVASRKRWIAEVLIPWCRAASHKDLQRAEREWPDIAGKVDPQATLWRWAWGRFPVLIVEGLNAFDETYVVTLTLHSGDVHTGFPDARKSEAGKLVLVNATDHGELGPFAIDDVQGVERADPSWS
jgi:hypothetical protein